MDAGADVTRVVDAAIVGQLGDDRQLVRVGVHITGIGRRISVNWR